ncbi:hypothetical protein A9K97_gp387 [Tokyovirus A1]|uniref:hypothetical protein n=1 Tax=Tokyovirus A1 TaxID=1826170 RepID=UPI0007A9856B|nr:hypothetical protein A9K97_gp387 [Tokyovirus A1]BAU79964.1 hypothetical protein [Tokyovirus A1]
MVNTFLPFESFEKTAKTLDNRRLNKQIIEAYQILTILEDLWFLSVELGELPPLLDHKCLAKSFVARCEWIKTFSKKYRAREEKFERTYEILLRGKDISSGKKGLQINLGFCCHPATKMWFGYERALRQYINACISELSTRSTKAGTKHSLPKKKIRVQRTVPLPWWLGYQKFHESHRASLLRKEPDFYQKKFQVQNPDLEYVWPSAMSEGDIDKIF